MQIIDNNEKMIFYKMELDINQKEIDTLVDYARMMIFDDKEELVNYAINRLLKESIESGEIKEILDKAEKDESK